MDYLSDILVALITGGVTLCGVIASNNKKQAIIETKLEHLTEEVKKHNGFAERIPVIEERIRVANARISDLEKEVNILEKEN